MSVPAAATARAAAPLLAVNEAVVFRFTTRSSMV